MPNGYDCRQLAPRVEPFHREAFGTSEEKSMTLWVINRGLVLEVGAARSPGCYR
jgi:hypothetical protein